MSVLYSMLVNIAIRHAGKVALICDNEMVTYAGLLHRVDEKAKLIGRDIRGVTMPLRTDVESVVALLACAKRHVCILPIAPDTSIDYQDQLTRDTYTGADMDNLPYLLLSTSGTTGEPKLIALTQETKVLRAQQFAGLYGVTECDIILVGTPLHYSMAQRLVFTTLMQGATARLLNGYSPERWVTEARQCSVVVGLPHQLQHMPFHDWPLLRISLNTSAPRNGTIAHADCWGTSEIAIATSLQPLTATTKDSDVGVPASGVLIRIEDDGEIAVKTPLLFSGYFKRPDLTAQAMTADGYFLTGDAGMLDEDGELHLLGRLNDVIKVGGVKVYPEEVERVVGGMTGVIECAAVGMPDDKLGEQVKVVIVMRIETRPPTLRQIQHTCVGWLTPSAMPRSVEYVDKLPRTANGKLLRRALK